MSVQSSPARGRPVKMTRGPHRTRNVVCPGSGCAAARAAGRAMVGVAIVPKLQRGVAKCPDCGATLSIK